MLSKLHRPAWLIGLVIYLVGHYADSAGMLTGSSRGILNGIALAFIAVGLFLSGRAVGIMMFNKIRHKL